MKYEKSATVQGGNCYIPKERYRVRCTATKLGKSNSGLPMTTLSMEIIEPESITHDGKNYMIAGRQFSYWLMHVQSESWGQARVEEFCTKLGIDTEDAYDDELHNEYFKGMEFDAVLSSEEDIKRKDRLPGQKVGDPILDGEGKPITNGWRVVAQLQDVLTHCNPVKNAVIAAQPT